MISNLETGNLRTLLIIRIYLFYGPRTYIRAYNHAEVDRIPDLFRLEMCFDNHASIDDKAISQDLSRKLGEPRILWNFQAAVQSVD